MHTCSANFETHDTNQIVNETNVFGGVRTMYTKAGRKAHDVRPNLSQKGSARKHQISGASVYPVRATIRVSYHTDLLFPTFKVGNAGTYLSSDNHKCSYGRHTWITFRRCCSVSLYKREIDVFCGRALQDHEFNTCENHVLFPWIHHLTVAQRTPFKQFSTAEPTHHTAKLGDLLKPLHSARKQLICTQYPLQH